MVNCPDTDHTVETGLVDVRPVALVGFGFFALEEAP
jgi:hypothetical protein